MPFTLYPPKKTTPKGTPKSLTWRLIASEARRKAFGTYVEPSLPVLKFLRKNLFFDRNDNKIKD